MNTSVEHNSKICVENLPIHWFAMENMENNNNLKNATHLGVARVALTTTETSLGTLSTTQHDWLVITT